MSAGDLYGIELAKKYDIVLIGKTPASLFVADFLHKHGNCSFVIINEIDKDPISTPQNILIDPSRHPLSARLLELNPAESYSSDEIEVKNPFKDLFSGVYSGFYGNHFWAGLHFWYTLDHNDVLQKIAKLSANLPNCENIIYLSIKDSQQLKRWDNMTVVEFLKQNCRYEKTRRTLKALIESFLGCDSENVSVLWFLWCVKLSGGVRSITNTSQKLIPTKTVVKILEANLPKGAIVDWHRSVMVTEDTNSFVKVEILWDEFERLGEVIASYVMDFSSVPSNLKGTENGVSLEVVKHVFASAPVVSIYGNMNQVGENFRKGSKIDITKLSRVFNENERFATTVHGNAALTYLALNKEQTNLNFEWGKANFSLPRGLLSSLDLKGLLPGVHCPSRLYKISPLLAQKFPNFLEGELIQVNEVLERILPQFGEHEDPSASGFLRSGFLGQPKSVDEDLKYLGVNMATWFNWLPSMRMVYMSLGLYLGFCCYKQFSDEAYEIIALLYIYYFFDSYRDRWFAPKSTRFQQFVNFFQLRYLSGG